MAGLFLTLDDGTGLVECTLFPDVYAKAAAEGMRSLREDGWEKVRQGITTIEEVLRVTRAG